MSTSHNRRVYKQKEEIAIIIGENTLRRSPRFLPNTCKEHEVKKPNETIPLPTILFKGKIVYVNNFYDCAMICDDIIQEIEKHKADVIPVGFDLEWPFSFQTGSGKTALAQICFNESVCYLLHIYNLNKLPASFVLLLTHPKVKLVGVNIKNDIWKLGRDFKDFPAKKVVEENCIDTGTYTNKVLNRFGRWSLERLTAYLLEKQIDKNPVVRKSKWHIQPLSKEQKIYAATDAYVSLLTYLIAEQKSIEEKVEDKQ